MASSAGAKKRSAGGGVSRELTTAAVAGSQCRAWLVTSKPGKRAGPPAGIS